MPAERTHDPGEVVSWADPPLRDGADLPAPTLRLVEGGAGHHDHAEPSEDAASPVGGAEGGTARALGGMGLVVGALDLGLALGVLVRTRRG